MTSPVIGEMTISIRGSNNSESVMKTYKYILSAAIAALAFASCGKEESTSIQGDRRNVTVYCPLTRTTIDYEGSDVSHLVWGAGENIGYVTSVSGDRVQLAKMNSNSFIAQIPAYASEEDSIFVIYPVGDNEGRLLSEIRLPLRNPETQNVSMPFDGGSYPMYGKAAIPSVSMAATNVNFEFPAAILRFRLFSETPGKLRTACAIEFSGKPYMEGEYAVDSYGAMSFVPAADNVRKEIKLVANEDSDLFLDSEGVYVYAVVPRAEISDFDVRVLTDSLTYSFNGGSMDLTRRDRSLWRISLNLNPESEDEPAAPSVFKPVTSLDELDEEGSYLIVADADEDSYFVAAPGTYPTATNGGTLGINAVTLAHADGNVDFSEDLLPCIVSLKKGSVEDDTFAISFDPSKGRNCWCCAPGAATFSVNNGFFFNPAPDTDSEEQGYWKFSYEFPYVVVTSRKVTTQHFYYVEDYRQFRPAREDATEDGHTLKGIKFLRLQ